MLATALPQERSQTQLQSIQAADCLSGVQLLPDLVGAAEQLKQQRQLPLAHPILDCLQGAMQSSNQKRKMSAARGRWLLRCKQLPTACSELQQPGLVPTGSFIADKGITKKLVVLQAECACQAWHS